MNIAMEQTEEYQNGVLKHKYGDAFIRGNNGTAPFPLTPATQSCSSSICGVSAVQFCTLAPWAVPGERSLDHAAVV